MTKSTQPINPSEPQLDFAATHYEVRILTDRGSFADRSDYCGSFNVAIVGEFAHISMLQGFWNAHCDRRLKHWLASQGVKHLLYERHQQTRYKPINASPLKTQRTVLQELHINPA